MSNDVAPVNGRDPFSDYSDEVSSRPFDGDILRFTKHGKFKAGQDQTTIDEGTRMIVFMPGLKRGWVKWVDSMPVQTIMGLVAEGFRPPQRDELDDLEEDSWPALDGKPMDPWQETNHLPMCDTDGNVYTFVSNSKGGRSAVGVLAKAYGTRHRMKPDEIPVIELEATSYDHKLYGETLKPSFKIVGWTAVPQTFHDLGKALVEDSSDETLALEDLMHEEEEAEELENIRQAAKKPEPKKPAPAKPSFRKPPPKPAPNGGNGRRSVRA